MGSLAITQAARVMKSVPSRGSVGSTILIRFVMGIDDPTLPRDGTDFMSLRCEMGNLDPTLLA
jgi:hypothetical protein